MAKFVVIHERWKCIGCSACVAVSPEHWEMTADDGKSDIKNCHRKIDTPEGLQEELDVDQPGTNKDAEDACPVNCIHVKASSDSGKTPETPS